ncbi:TetR/AcrR family transcriptional regulator [Rhodococcoides kyotonense]|uniref:DNA-binding transcriptional regulator, AcrR family n=1 Tax=Rhodococcoides kyotonense TaxID=398843 RepID=A0A239IUY8_9NOCA|nr:TetR/AcrR family transcriptional regulator [Rhodococcus kyotonensis]SNS97038.1 DNA-binding transcriptional regulator, AcrR family [Rhodococcus kyotonensis]
MGLREVHAAQTRELILDAAFSLFLDRGYEKTTMEDIAAKAEVGTTTLYRYYPSKDLLVIGPLEFNGQMAEELRARPADEPLDLALGHAVRALLVAPRAGTDRIAQIEKVMLTTPSLQTRLLEQYVAERRLLGEAIAERLGRSPDDLYCRAAARMASMVLELVGEKGTLSDIGDSDAAAARAVEDLKTVTQQLVSNPPPFPRL